MERTTIMLPAPLKEKALQYARKKGISLGELIRASLAAVISHSRNIKNRDTLFSDTEVYTGDVPSDLSFNHDNYLYGSDS